MARLSEARHFYLKKMKKFAFVLLALAVLASCKNEQKFRTYEMAETEFRQSLTFKDTLAVLVLGQNFMDAMKAGTLDLELSNLCVVYNDTLYKVSDRSLLQLRQRFGSAAISDYALASYNFSTPGINDLSYRYTMDGKVGSSPAFKITFNPVKVGDAWFLTLKDGDMSSIAKDPAAQVHPLSPAPNPIVLNTR